MLVHVCNPNTQEAEVGRLWVLGQAGLHSKTLSQKQKKNFCGEFMIPKKTL
jgi:hypothetical protein